MVALVILVLSALLWWPVLARGPLTVDTDSLLLVGLLLTAAFLASEIFPMRVEVRRETFLVSLSELPLAIGLLVVPAWVVGVANLVGGGIVYLIRRDSWRNSLLNLSLLAIETGTAAAVLLLFTGPDSTPEQRYLPLAVAVVAGGLVSSLAVGLTYRLLGPAEPMRRVFGRSLLAACSIVTFALVAYTVWRSGPVGPYLCGGLAVVLLVLYRTYFNFLRQHADLARMYSFGRRVTGVGSSLPDWRELLEQIRDQLNAQVAVLHLGEGDAQLPTLAVGPDGTVDEPTAAPDDPLLAMARASGSAKASNDRTHDRAVLAALGQRKAWDVLVVPLRSGNRTRGFLEVRDRRSRWGRFDDDDLQLLATLSGHVATALDNLRLLESLRHEAYHDAITGLLNRQGLSVEVQRALAGGGVGAVLLVELDVLSGVNNALGHDRGEQLLRAAGERLAVSAAGTAGIGTAGTSPAGTGPAQPARPVARIEADRFAVLLEQMPEAQLTAIARDLLLEVGRPFSLDGVEVDPEPTAGIAQRTSQDGDSSVDPNTLLQRAEMALLAARSKEETVAIYRPSMGEVFRRRFQLVTQFRQAVDQGRIVVHYQPKLDLAARELTGVEALVRWMHPEFGLVSPAEFVEAIEATGSIDILLGHVLDIVLGQLRAWSDQGIRIGAAVNLSARNLLAQDFCEMVGAALARQQVAPELLTFEITESSVMAAPEHSLPVLLELHAMGVQLSVDDFGTGYSSLAYLRRLPIDEIKIDKSFVQGMNTDLGDLAIVRAIIDLGHSLDLRVVAEGVEEEAARDVLLEMRCDQAQGFLLSRPLPIDRFDAWLRARTVSVAEPGSSTHVLRLMG